MLMIQILTYATLLIELFIGIGIFIPRIRAYAILAWISLHLGMEITMSIPYFEWVMFSALLACWGVNDTTTLKNDWKYAKKRWHKSRNHKGLDRGKT